MNRSVMGCSLLAVLLLVGCIHINVGAGRKAELVEKVAQKTGLSVRETRTVIDAVFDPDPQVGVVAAELVSGNKVAISGFVERTGIATPRERPRIP